MRKIGVGYVTENGDGKNFRINVHVYSLLPETKTKDGATIEAFWLSSQNRITPPTVYKGETVDIYATENTDIYYWKPVKYETDLRCHENVTYVWSNKKDKDDSVATVKNSHSFTVDATNQVIVLNTATNRGEKAGYTISLNLKDGVLLIKDTLKHTIKLDSVNKLLETTVENISFKCETFKVDASKSVDIKTPNYHISGGKVVCDSTVTQNKAMTLNGPLTQNSTSSFKGMSKFSSLPSTTPAPDGHTHKVI